MKERMLCVEKRTDLAVEATKMTKGNIEGVESECENLNEIKIERVRITTDDAAKAVGKPKGSYVTITTRDLSDNDKDSYEEACVCLGKELKKILKAGTGESVLAVGLGNEDITADSIGPKSIKKLLVTRHIKEMMPDEIDESVRSVSALAPSVMAVTGIETTEIVKGVAEKVKPSIIIAIDALAARSVQRLGRTIQIADTGINPGSGVGNNRKELSENTLGVPVVAIGVPMVVDAVTLATDCMETVAGEENREKLAEICNRTAAGSAEMVVTPKNVDSLAERSARIIANGINLALQSALGREDIDRYVPN